MCLPGNGPETWASAAEDDGIYDLVALVADMNPIHVSIPGDAKVELAFRLADISSNGPAHAEEDRASAAIGLPDDDCGIPPSRSGNAELAFAHWMACGKRARQSSAGIEAALPRAQCRIIRSHRGTSVRRYRGPEVGRGDVPPEASSKLLNVAPVPTLDASAPQVVEDRARLVPNENPRGRARPLAQIQHANDLPVSWSPILWGRWNGGGRTGVCLPHVDTAVGHQAQIQLPILEQIGANMAGLRDDAFVHARDRAEGTRSCERTERKTAARCIVARFGRPRSRGTVAVELHRDTAVTVKPHGVEGAVAGALVPSRVIHRLELNQSPLCARQGRNRLRLFP